MAKRKEFEDDDFFAEEIDEWADEADENAEYEEDAGDVEEEGDSEEEVDSGEEAVEVEPEEEEVYPPDDEKAVAALRKLRVRLDENQQGNIWRAIFDDANGKDQALILLSGLPALKELWLIGTKVTPEAVQALREDRPKVTIFY